MFEIRSNDGTLLFLYKKKRMEEGYRDRIHCYDECKIVRVLEGRGIWQIGGREYTVEGGDILIMSRADLRTIRKIEQSPLTIEQLNFAPAFLAPDQEVASFFVKRPQGFENLLPQAAELNQGLDALITETEQRRPYQKQALRARLTEWVIAAARVLPQEPSAALAGARQRQAMEQAVDYIKNHYAEPLNLEQVAREFYLSPSYFSRLFRKHTGLGFREYLGRVRVQAVLALLEDRNINVLDAALQCGFSGSSGFYRTFHHVTGGSPGHFRS
ncbi:MAG: helix-turn-helix transcriptional regulator [Clostridia bacterium]|nr:helix-turn-helix transcriptional regulator [Clostridia bacterium]